jgi:hypothetical protein
VTVKVLVIVIVTLGANAPFDLGIFANQKTCPTRRLFLALLDPVLVFGLVHMLGTSSAL